MKNLLLAILCVGSLLCFARWLYDHPATAQGGGAGAPPVANGDVNGDAARDISDAVYLLNWLFTGGPEPVACAQEQGDLEQRVALLESIVLGSCLGLPDGNGDRVPDCAQPGTDADQDGFARGVDCDDADASVHPGAAEVCNGTDDDCDAQVDEGIDLQVDLQNCGACGRRCAANESCVGGECFPVSIDEDLDGFSPPQDCDDANSAVSPAAPEVCDDGIDNDCDGATDTGDSDC
jgi:hypothetical protein